MLRECSLEDISDGRLYTENDLVRTDTGECVGCKQSCCQNMGNTIVLDPFDIYSLTTHLEKSFNELMGENIELNVVDGVILPNLKMSDLFNKCSFLDENERCSIHNLRPGICRLFPLGRYWEDDEHFKYILQKGQCHKDNLTKIKVKKWLGITGISEYNAFVVKWHKFLKQIQRSMTGLNNEQVRILNKFILKTFYQTPYSKSISFANQFDDRLMMVKDRLGLEE